MKEWKRKGGKRNDNKNEKKTTVFVVVWKRKKVKKKNIKKVKAIKPKKSAVSENYKITSFKDIDEEINVKSAKDARAERKFEKKKAKYI